MGIFLWAEISFGGMTHFMLGGIFCRLRCFLSVGDFFVSRNFFGRLPFFFVGGGIFGWMRSYLVVEFFSVGWIFFVRWNFLLPVVIFLLVEIFFVG